MDGSVVAVGVVVGAVVGAVLGALSVCSLLLPVLLHSPGLANQPE